MYKPQLPFKAGFIEVNGEYVEVITPEAQADAERDIMLADMEMRLLLTEFEIIMTKENEVK